MNDSAARQPDRRRMEEGDELQPQPQSVQPGRRHRRIRPGRCRRCRCRRRRRHRRLPGLGDRQHPGAQRRARQDRHRDPRAPRRARHPAVARRGQDPARGHRRSHAGRPDLQVLRRRMPAPVGRAAAFGAPGHRRRDHARADRRGRTDHAVELPDRDPGLEDRAGARLRQLRGPQARRPGAGLARGRWPRSSPLRASRPACSTW